MTLLLLIFLFTGAEDIPLLNQRIIAFVDARMGRTVGTGECWDLAAGALEYAGAYLNRHSEETLYIFGKQMDPWKNPIFPGDIIQFENVIIRYKKGRTIYTKKMPHHTAIIYEVQKPGQYLIAHQNSSETGRKVGISPLDLKNIIRGKYMVYRPLPDR